MRISARFVAPLAALAVGFGAGFLLRGSAEPEAKHAGHGQATQYYVCEKHGHVHRGPGTCPVDGEILVPAPKMEAAAPQGDRKVKFWRSPMDPTFMSKGPGKDNMGMDLVPVYEGDPLTQTGMVVIESAVVQQMGIRTATLKHGDLVRRIRTVGNVTYNEEQLGTVTAKLDGWVEELHVDKTGQMVKVGDALFDIYSKDLEAAQVAYLDSLADPRLKLTDRPGERELAASLLVSTRRRLEYWDIPEDQIDAISKTGRVRRTLTIRSRFRGVVTSKTAVEGRFFKAGAPLFEIANLDTVWVYASIYEFERPWVKVGQEATIALSYVPGKNFPGVVEFVYPYLNEKTRDITVRMRFDNKDGALLPGMFANATMDCSLGTHALLVPEEAVLDTGTRKLVFVVRGLGRFEGRDVRLGVRAADGMWEVLDGLKTGDEVVVSGQFLLDAESKVREAIRKFLDTGGEGAPAPSGGHSGH